MSWSDLITSADRAVRDHLGSVAVEYRPASGLSVVVSGMFDERYVLLEPGQLGVEQVGPAVWLRLDELPSHPDDDDPVLVIGGISYHVRERQPDGMGSIRLLLHRGDL